MLPVHCAWRKYGPPKIIILAILERDMLPRAEYLAVIKYNTLLPHGYNCIPGGGISPTSFPEIAKKVSIAMKGRKFSEEHRANISKARSGQKASAELRALYSRLRKGRKHSPETKAKISAGQMGRIQSSEARAKMSAAKKGKPGRIWTTEQRRKLSINKRGKRRTEETRLKIAMNNRLRAQLGRRIKEANSGQFSLFTGSHGSPWTTASGN